MVNRQMKRFSTSLIIRGMQMKTTVIYQLASVSMAVIKHPMRVGSVDLENIELLYAVGGIGASAMENSMEVSKKIKNIITI